MMEIWPDRCTSLAKKELKYAGPFGLAAWLAGTVFVDRLNRERAKDTMDKTVKLLKEKNVSAFRCISDVDQIKFVFGKNFFWGDGELFHMINI